MGREYDTPELYYYRARYYDPTIQRFISEDPIGLRSGDYNFYGYAGNDPVNKIDPTGLFDMNCYAKCLEKRRWDLWKYLVLFAPIPKRFVPPYRVPKKSQPWTSLYSVGLHGLGRVGVPKSVIGPLRRGVGRRAIPAVLLIDGVYDWYLLIDCALDCRDHACD